MVGSWASSYPWQGGGRGGGYKGTVSRVWQYGKGTARTQVRIRIPWEGYGPIRQAAPGLRFSPPELVSPHPAPRSPALRSPGP